MNFFFLFFHIQIKIKKIKFVKNTEKYGNNQTKIQIKNSFYLKWMMNLSN